MARAALAVSAAGTTIGSEGFGPSKSSDSVAKRTAFETTLATLVADGATPTQAHVTAANTAYTAFTSALGDVELSYDTTNVTSVSSLRAPVKRLIHAARAAGLGE